MVEMGIAACTRITELPLHIGRTKNNNKSLYLSLVIYIYKCIFVRTVLLSAPNYFYPFLNIFNYLSHHPQTYGVPKTVLEITVYLLIAI